MLNSISTLALSHVTGGAATGCITAGQAQTILKQHYPGATVDLPRVITADGRGERSLRGGWRGTVQLNPDPDHNGPFQALVSCSGQYRGKDPHGQGDL
jgi:hypothetical protein